jgi:hypothetical protein
MFAHRADDQHTSIDDLDGALRYLTEELGYENYPALWEMSERIWNGQLRLTRQIHVDGKSYFPWDHPTMHGTPKPCNQEPVDPSFFRSNLILEFDRHDRVQVISQSGFEWCDFRYRIAKGCDVRAICWSRRPPAPQAAPDQQPEDSAGPDPFRTGAAGRPTPAHLIKAEAERRITEKEVTPTGGGLADFSRKLADWWNDKRKTFEPHGPEMTAGSIKNVVRELWNAALSVQN